WARERTSWRSPWGAASITWPPPMSGAGTRHPWRGPGRGWAHMGGTGPDESTGGATPGAGWRTRPGPVTFDSMYEGETFSPSEDPRAWMLPGYDDADWAKARTATDAGSPLLQRQIQEPVVITAEIRAEVVSRTARQVVLDMGQVISG